MVKEYEMVKKWGQADMQILELLHTPMTGETI